VILVDTSPILAALNRRDPDHARCRKLLDEHAREMLVTPYVVTEVCWLAGSRIGALAEANVVEAVAAGEFQQVDPLSEDLVRIAELLRRYQNLHGGEGLGVADASTVAVPERLNITRMATLDTTDFRIVVPRHVPALELLP
jgi:predicted nucleic acid-binding protein